MRGFYVIEYLDEEGEQNVKHVLLEPGEAQMLVEEMAKNGICGSVRNLSPSTCAKDETVVLPLRPDHRKTPEG